LSPRRTPFLLLLAPLLLVAGCATGRASRHFTPASDVQKEETLAAVAAAQERADSMAASRLLYDARIRPGKGPAVPGMLAVTYDGREVAHASLTGPFGKRVAEYDAGSLTGEDSQALVVDPGALRAVLSGTWPGKPSSVEGCDGDECLVVWTPSGRSRVGVSAVVDRRAGRLRSLVLDGDRGKLVVTYEARADEAEGDAWPRRVDAREERSGRGLKLVLVAQEAAGGSSPAASRAP
jgi:hypothetical protein